MHWIALGKGKGSRKTKDGHGVAFQELAHKTTSGKRRSLCQEGMTHCPSGYQDTRINFHYVWGHDPTVKTQRLSVSLELEYPEVQSVAS